MTSNVIPPARKVLFLIPTLTGGGAERVIVTLLTHLDRSRFKPTLAVVDMRRAVFRAEIPPDVEVIDLGAMRVRYAASAIVRLIWRTRPDVVLSTLGHLNVVLSILKPVFPRGIRTIARESCVVSETLASSPYPRLLSFLYRHFYRKHDLVVCQSMDMQEDLRISFGLPADRTMIIHNPVDMEKVRHCALASVDHPVFAAGATVLLAAGRLEHQKGFDLLIEAVASMPDSGFQVVILGEGPLEGDLRALVRKHDLEGRIHFAGFQRNPYAWIAKADAFVLPSRYEGFPNVVLEALACSTPVIATPAPGGINELLGGRPECIVATAIDAPALANAIESWLRGARGKVPPGAIAHYSVERIVSRYEQVLNLSVG